MAYLNLGNRSWYGDGVREGLDLEKREDDHFKFLLEVKEDPSLKDAAIGSFECRRQHYHDNFHRPRGAVSMRPARRKRSDSAVKMASWR
ncbi:hypothetical protein NECAME_08588 [Necator americanus]|uniref:Uncharacterized protein n=1 Tax=Necator americanus TaxID=51031 RepID=W2TGW4_NECAM|nr:hypothetical protein NECAME_08588 [Necator americanus]ETN81280.1 hypothetical protein NECAME_08588 [Necator americanus]